MKEKGKQISDSVMNDTLTAVLDDLDMDDTAKIAGTLTGAVVILDEDGEYRAFAGNDYQGAFGDLDPVPTLPVTVEVEMASGLSPYTVFVDADVPGFGTEPEISRVEKAALEALRAEGRDTAMAFRVVHYRIRPHGE